MNNDTQQSNNRFIPRHTSYIRDMSDKTGRSYRELEAEWLKAEREFEFSRMRDPLKYANLRNTNGTVAQEISRIFEDNVMRPEEIEQVEIEEIIDDETENEFGDDILDNITDDTNAALETAIEDEIDVDIDVTVDSDEEGSENEAVPNNSILQQRRNERPGTDNAETVDAVNSNQ